jgi:hypothetical protein
LNLKASKETAIKTSLTIEQRINDEQKKIKPLFKYLDRDKKRFIEKMIYQLAFMQVTLARLVEEINKGEILEDFTQGSQQFKRGNTALKDYNATIKGYISLTKTLCDMLPDSEQENAGQALMGFVAKPK